MREFFADVVFGFTLSMQSLTGASFCDDGVHTTEFDNDFQYWAMMYELDWCRFKAKSVVESNIRVNVCSHAGACGCMQLKPSTARDIERKYHIPHRELTDCRHSIRLAAIYSREKQNWAMLNEADDPQRFGEAAYNAGQTRVRNIVVNIALGFVWTLIRSSLPTESINYVIRIDKAVQRLRTYTASSERVHI